MDKSADSREADRMKEDKTIISEKQEQFKWTTDRKQQYECIQVLN